MLCAIAYNLLALMRMILLVKRGAVAPPPFGTACTPLLGKLFIVPGSGLSNSMPPQGRIGPGDLVDTNLRDQISKSSAVASKSQKYHSESSEGVDIS